MNEKKHLESIFDTSSFVKRFVEEVGSEQAVNITKNASGQLEIKDATDRVSVDDITITRNASNQLEVKDAGIGVDQINASIAGDGLQGGSGSALAVDVSDFAGFGLEDDGSENLRVASSGIGNGLTGGSGSVVSVQADSAGGANLAKSINVSVNGVAVKVDNSTIDQNTSEQLRLSYDQDNYSSLQ